MPAPYVLSGSTCGVVGVGEVKVVCLCAVCRSRARSTCMSACSSTSV